VNEQLKALSQFTRSDIFLVIDSQHVASLWDKYGVGIPYTLPPVESKNCLQAKFLE
jgi:hypothetical protein